MTEDRKSPDNENVLAQAKEFIGQVTGDEERAAEGRKERLEAQKGTSLEEAVEESVKGATGKPAP